MATYDSNAGEPYEIEHELILSTAHIRRSDSILLEQLRNRKDHLIPVDSFEDGWIIPTYVVAHREDFNEWRKEGLSEELIALVRLAHHIGCKRLRLDADGQIRDDLPQFDW
jgi:hypothetical protein